MAVSPSFRAFVQDQLSRGLAGISTRGMFGGVGIYAGDLFFALIAEDTLYLKVDDSNRPDFESRKLGPFRPFGSEGEVMQYYEVPAEVLESGDELAEWAGKALEVARRARVARRPRGPRRPRGK